MLKLNEVFLEEVGLSGMPEQEKGPFLDHILEEIEVRVGQKLSQDLTDEQMDEFDQITSGNDDAVSQWLNVKVPGYSENEDYKKLALTLSVESNNNNLNVEYAANKWFEMYRPNYQQMVQEVFEGLKNEIRSNRDTILGS